MQSDLSDVIWPCHCFCQLSHIRKSESRTGLSPLPFGPPDDQPHLAARIPEPLANGLADVAIAQSLATPPVTPVKAVLCHHATRRPSDPSISGNADIGASATKADEILRVVLNM